MTALQGDTVRFRVVNASTETHPMHLHGSYFKVTALTVLRRSSRRRAHSAAWLLRSA